MNAPLAAQADAAQAATTREQRAAEIRNQGVRGALGLLDAGMPRTAAEVIRTAVETQAYLLTGVRFDLGGQR